MEIKFNNQLTKEELNEGVLAYLFKRFIMIQSLLVLTVIFIATLVWSIIDGTLFDTTILIFIIMYLVFLVILLWLVWFSFTALKRQFDIKETETYIIKGDELIIKNDNSKSEPYPLGRLVKVIGKKNIYLLVLNKQKFKIISKKVVSKENIDILNQKIEEAQNG